MVLGLRVELEFGIVGFLMDGGKPEKNPQTEDNNQRETTLRITAIQVGHGGHCYTNRANYIVINTPCNPSSKEALIKYSWFST